MHIEKVTWKCKEWINKSVVHLINTLKYNLGLRKIAKRELSNDFRTGPRFQPVRYAKCLLSTPDWESNST